MANDTKIGCRAGKTKLVEPNNFDGQRSSTNVSVPLEDLTISVILKTRKKGRTVLSADNKSKGSSENSETIAVNFIEGTNINGKHVLTTKFTDLTTIFDDNSSNENSENLGITNIDIDFNSAQAPQISITFIDIKGSAIFQNEGNISNNKSKNKYATFFQLPYPMFDLTIKGYYGKPVTYCLHMVKFNSKFNSQTGNFEIICNFVGFTYAMLSDLLLGYLKAIPYTNIGKERYNEINNNRQANGLLPIGNLDDLMRSISDVNLNLTKLTENDLNSQILVNNAIKIDTLSGIENNLASLGRSLDKTPNKDSIERFNFIIVDSTKDKDSLIKKYVKDVTDTIKNFNTDSTIKVDDKLFIDLSPLTYQGLSRDLLIGNDANSTGTLRNIMKNVPEGQFGKKVETLTSYIRPLPISNTLNFDVIDLTSLYLYIDSLKTTLNNNTNEAKEQLAITIRATIKEKLGFDPTVRNIIEVFTTAVEVFMESVYSISVAAENPTNVARTAQLSQKFNNLENSDHNSDKLLVKKYFPWPDYREQSGTDGYVEKYLGEPNVLENPSDVNELVFIDDLLKGFLSAFKASQEAQSLESNGETNWFPINPLDTRLFDIENKPYKRVGENGLTDYNVVANLMLIRGMTFLNENNNKNLSVDEIRLMAEIEGKSILSDINDLKIKEAISQLSLEKIQNLSGIISDKARNIVTLDGDTYRYTYFPKTPNSDLKILPINEGFSGSWTKDGIWIYDDSINSDKTVYLTNYSNLKTGKPIDGGIYAKFFDSTDYNKFNGLEFSNKPDKVDISNNTLILEKLKKPITNPKSVGFNVFGGIYGIQEFAKLDYGDPQYANLPLMYMFYKEKSELGLANKAKITLKPKTGTLSESFLVNKIPYYFSIVGPEFNMVREARNSQNSDYFNNIGKNWINLSPPNTNTLTYPFVSQSILSLGLGAFGLGFKSSYFSLFGSRWFYGQSQSNYPLYAKGLLFLNTLPFTDFPFEAEEIKRLFDTRVGFIHMPKLWAAYVGGLLWRNDTSMPILENGVGRIIGGGSGPTDPIVWKYQNKILLPFNDDESDYIATNRNQSIFYLYNESHTSQPFTDLSPIITNMPEQTKNEFKKVFFDFINENGENTNNTNFYDFASLNNKAQIVTNGTIQSYDLACASLYGAMTAEYNSTFSNESGNYGYINDSFINNNFINLNYYERLIPLYNSDLLEENFYPYQIELIFKDTLNSNGGVSPVNDILTMFTAEIVLANTNTRVWETPELGINAYSEPYISKNKFDIYFNKLISSVSASTAINSVIEKKELEQSIFGTSDENIIKFQLYRTCKNIYDKWLGGVDNIDNVMFQCGGNSESGSGRNSLDIQIAKKYNSTATKSRFIDSFRFVSRSYADIGDKLFINPVPVNQFLLNNPNSSFFDAVSSLLSSNNFNFVPLPTYINYNDDTLLKQIFEPIPDYQKAIEGGVCGPAFVCVYVGQTSKNLDLNGTDYPNDGFDFRCVDGNMTTSLPQDFSNSGATHENDVAVFSINYGQQNQNIFKDITLDQSEFAETAESIQITDAISKRGSENNTTLAGQNLYNVYSVRSYKAEVEMMGNAMIQPMMHFQLNNIPMFHGGYLITRVRHTIKPNNMSTNFTGVRLRFAETKLITASDLYMSLIDSLDLSNTSKGRTNNVAIASYPPIVLTIKSNGGVNGNIEAGNIKLAKFDGLPKGVTYYNVDNSEKVMLSEAIQPAKDMMNDWITWMKNQDFKGVNGEGKVFANVNSMYRTVVTQQEIYDSSPSGTAARPGTSNHGWGIAIDFQFYNKNGVQIKNKINGRPNPAGFNLTTNPALAWLLDNGYKYGFIIPESLRDGQGTEEFWHFEYHGNIAACILNQNPIIKTYRVDTSKNYSSSSQYAPSVLNPYLIGNNPLARAKYEDCLYKSTTNVDGSADIILGSDADVWSLLSICSLEAGNPQARCDVAQSIYNRLATPKKPYGGSIKEIITAKNQYEPTFKNRNDWFNIKDEKTAITAIMNAKSVSKTKAKEYLNDTKLALTNTTLVNNSKLFIGSRTEFLAYHPKSTNAIGVVERKPSTINNTFYWEYAGKALYVSNAEPGSGIDFS